MDDSQHVLIEDLYHHCFQKRALPAPYSVLREPVKSLLTLWDPFRSSCDASHSVRDLFLQLAPDFRETIQALASHSRFWIQASGSSDDNSTTPLISDDLLRLCNEFHKRVLLYKRTIEIILDAASRVDKLHHLGDSSAARLQSALGEFFAGSPPFHQGPSSHTFKRVNSTGTLSIHYDLGQAIQLRLEEEVNRTVGQLGASPSNTDIVALKARHAIYWLQSSSLDIKPYTSSIKYGRSSDADSSTSCIFLDCLKSALLITGIRFSASSNPESLILEQVVHVIEEACLEQIKEIYRYTPSSSVFSLIHNHGRFQTSITPIPPVSQVSFNRASPTDQLSALSLDPDGQGHVAEERPNAFFYQTQKPSTSASSPTSPVGFSRAIGERRSLRTPSWGQDIERNSAFVRWNQMANDPGRQRYPSTAVSYSTTRQPATSGRNPLIESDSMASTASPVQNLDSYADIGGSESRINRKYVPLPSSSAHEGDLFFSSRQISDNEWNPEPQQYPYYERQNSFPTQHNIMQLATRVESPYGLDVLPVPGVERSETAGRIEDVSPRADEVELSDVEDESKASKGFFRNVFSMDPMTHDHERTYQPSKVRMFKNKSSGDIHVYTERNLGNKRDMFSFIVGTDSELIPRYAFVDDPPDKAEIRFRKNGLQSGLRYRFSRDTAKRNPLELFGFQGALTSMKFEVEYRLACIHFHYKRLAHTETFENVLLQLWTEKSSNSAVEHFIEMTKQGLQASEDVSIQTIDHIKAMVASSRIFILANGCIYVIIVSDRIKIGDPRRWRLPSNPSGTHATKMSLVPSSGYPSVRVKITKGSHGAYDFAGLPISQRRIPRLDEGGPNWVECQSVGFEFHNETGQKDFKLDFYHVLNDWIKNCAKVDDFRKLQTKGIIKTKR